MGKNNLFACLSIGEKNHGYLRYAELFTCSATSVYTEPKLFITMYK